MNRNNFKGSPVETRSRKRDHEETKSEYNPRLKKMVVKDTTKQNKIKISLNRDK